MDEHFWPILVSQLAQTVPAIRHIVTAIGISFRMIEDAPFVDRGHLSVLRETTTAMKSLSEYIDLHPNSYLIPLVSNLLLICLDFIHGRVDSAMVHMTHGLHMLEKSRLCVYQPAFEIRIIEDYLLPIYSRISAVSILFCFIPSREFPLIQEDHKFTTLAQARQSLFQLMNPALHFIRQGGIASEEHRTSFEHYVEQIKLKAGFDNWLERWNAFVPQLSPSSAHAANILLIQYRVVLIWMSVCLDCGETILDSHISDFQEIIDLATNVVGDTRDCFSFDMQLVPTLYYTVIKCRVPSMRRSALDLLRRCTLQEGLFKANIAVAIGKRVIQLEEESGLVNSTEGYVPEQSRIRNIRELPAEFNVTTDYALNRPRSVDLTIQTRPFGLDGAIVSTTETILL
jgi:hypothetical protein